MSTQPTLSSVKAGYALPAVVKHPTTRQLVQYAGASGDFYEIHYDKDFALAQGLPGVILHGALKSAFLAQVATDWMGPAGRLTAFSVRYRDMDIPGEALTCRGTVKAVDAAAGTVSVELALVNAAGKTTTTGEATITLPT
ncbi:MAG: MaoC/PaaZ C-terminal domain-containing protein [Chloroflexota bacterium]